MGTHLSRNNTYWYVNRNFWILNDELGTDEEALGPMFEVAIFVLMAGSEWRVF